MIAYKFLTNGSRGPFTGHPWRAGVWQEAAVDLRRGTGIHACRARDLSYWLCDELWEIEIGGDVHELETQLVASRGCLRRRVDAWGPGVAGEFARACTWRTRDRAVELLAARGLAADAERLADCRELSAVESTVRSLGPRIASVGGYLADVAHFAATNMASTCAYVAAVAADFSGHGFKRERSTQAQWITSALG